MGWMVPVGIVTAVSASHAFRTWVRARHGYPLDDDRRGRRRHGAQALAGDTIGADRSVALLEAENERLTGKIGRLEERIAVLERIATDPAVRTAREIEALRDR
ncbi:hypothetical protein ACYZX9_03185 [Sphingomonas citri]|uniref:Uncharacterized protein n=1 Tax=Sphingomonas citri TaxID=2862499 RepID=A0ABS7BHW6_9SPHN|nr:hypothetical protein [Sphingomonas citri]MBW6529215.1 hypothetical protein [Sphingomonas citri]